MGSAMHKWQPIATAPRDGTPVIVYAPDLQDHGGMYWPEKSCGSRFVTIAAFGENEYGPSAWHALDSTLETSYGGEDSFDYIHCQIISPTHWMPLPEAPDAE
jgi:hypothetical protein